VGNCTPGCTCDVLAQMVAAYDARSWVQSHFWWTTFSDSITSPPGETWDNSNIFTSKTGDALTNPVGLKFRTLATGG
jgi:hypothetical protein